MKQRTRFEKDKERDKERSSELELFKSKLENIQTLAEAKSLVLDAPEPDSVMRRFYSNLGFFLQEFIVPSRAGRDERQLYVQFITRLDESGQLKPGWGESILARLTASLDSD
jgi:hypothetical protein